MRFARLTAALPLLALAACGDDAAPVHDDRAKVELRFEARVGKEAFDCDRVYDGLGTTGASAAPLDFRLYVHDFRLVRADGSEEALDLDQDGRWQHQDVALLDFEDKTGTCANGTPDTNTMIHGLVAAGAYEKVRFKLGVPEGLNHADNTTAPSPLNLSSLFWSWQAGYKFVRADFRVADPNAVFSVHLGSTGCSVHEEHGGEIHCAQPNVPEIELPYRPSGPILVDYAALVGGSDLVTDGGCMSGPTEPSCAPIFSRLGLDPDSGASRPGQTLFRLP
ncbi:MbnP family copper-binding protein [Vulgatibacter incomptus]|uniref:Copper-binding protein MbnP-like domain-containing protein n=1 Tax=Vulgatibacter incomptus TaxID=1391653 RepID=A0A0K1PDV7_9BACT|nr:MbnP family copper-binding protein [Vulgatibacter incomptus]AKU91299.1 hypothetical protein AKJ08_1686 [Vulgatibacter incomptus]